MNWIYEKTPDNSSRFVLGERGENNLVCIGVNPSTATPELLDNTLRTVKKLSKQHGFDGWIMMNLYPQRATNPNEMHPELNRELHALNLMSFEGIFADGNTTIWAAWGALIEKRSYLTTCMEDIVALSEWYSVNWHTIGARSKAGHPHHPLYLNHSLPMETFSMQDYLKTFGDKYGV
jgi:hypothetical protein